MKDILKYLREKNTRVGIILDNISFIVEQALIKFGIYHYFDIYCFQMQLFDGSPNKPNLINFQIDKLINSKRFPEKELKSSKIIVIDDKEPLEFGYLPSNIYYLQYGKEINDFKDVIKFIESVEKKRVVIK